MSEESLLLDGFEAEVDGLITMWSLWEHSFWDETGGALPGVLPECMHHIGREFFEFSSWAMLNTVILALCRLGADGDSFQPGRRGSRENLTVNRVLAATDFGDRSDLKATATNFAGQFRTKVSGKLKHLRNRCISHNDLSNLAGEGARADVATIEVQKCVHLLRRFQDPILAARRGSELDADVAWGTEASKKARESVRQLLAALQAEVERKYSGED